MVKLVRGSSPNMTEISYWKRIGHKSPRRRGESDADWGQRIWDAYGEFHPKSFDKIQDDFWTGLREADLIERTERKDIGRRRSMRRM